MISKTLKTIALGLLLIALPIHAEAQPPVPERADGARVDAPQLEEPEVLDGAPLHEAFARPLVLEADAITINQQPPEPIDELPPEQRPEGKNVHWLPGYWYFDVERDDFVWISGLWRDFPPGRTWVPGEWQQVDAGFQWVAGYWADAQVEEQRLLPLPPETLEVGPSSPAPGDNYLWAPGCWQWQNSSYAWQPGFWYAAQPNWVWVPNHYSYTPRGALFVRGYWDYPLVRRGLVYAPVYWGSGYRFQSGLAYRPRTFINTSLLLGSLYLDSLHGRYYYGSRWGVANNRPNWLTPWGTNTFSRYGRYNGRTNLYDPLYSHFRWDGHARHGHGQFRHQDLANINQRDGQRSRDRDDFYRKMDRLSVAERNALNLQRNNAKDLTKFRQETETLRNFSRAKLVRNQLENGKKTLHESTPLRGQVAVNGEASKQRSRNNGQRGRDRDVTARTNADVRIDNDGNPRDKQSARTGQNRGNVNINGRTRLDANNGRARVNGQANVSGALLPQAQVRMKAQVDSDRRNNSNGDRPRNSNFQSEQIQRQQRQRGTQNSSNPSTILRNETLRNQTLDRNRGSRLNQQSTPPATINRSRIPQTFQQSTNRARQANPAIQFQQRTAKPPTSINSNRSLRSNNINGATPQRMRQNYRPPTRNATPNLQQSRRNLGASMRSSRGSGGRNFSNQLRGRGKK